MENMFEKYFGNGELKVKRINAIDFSNLTEIAQLLEIDASEDPRRQIGEFCDPVYSVALSLSQLKAIGAAYSDDVDFALIMEDDASFELVPLWPKSLNQLVEELDTFDPNWEAIRLQYTIISGRARGNLTETWKEGYPDLPPFVAFNPRKRGQIFGLVATLWSRRGLSRFQKAFINLDGRPKPAHLSDDPYSGFTYSFRAQHAKPKRCIFDTYINYTPLKQYVATPPYFSYRLAEDTLGYRRNGTSDKFNDHILVHCQSRAFASRFFATSLELKNNIPSNLPRFAVTLKGELDVEEGDEENGEDGRHDE